MKKRIVPLLATAIAPLCLDGCLTIDLTRLADATAAPEKGSVQIRVFEKGSDQSRGKTTDRRVVTELFRTEKGGAQPVREDSASDWTLPDLEPGEYEIRVSRWIDEDGNLRKLRSSEKERFQLRPGKRVRADVILKDKGGLSAGLLSAIFSGLAVIGVVAAFHSVDINVEEDAGAVRSRPATSAPPELKRGP